MPRKVVTNELRQYLADHAVYSELQQAMEAVVAQAPERPVAFLRAYFSDLAKGVKTRKILVRGPPGAGAGRLARSLAERYGVPLIQPDPSLSEADIPGFMACRLSECRESGWVMEGFPLTEIQAFGLKTVVTNIPTHVLEIYLSEEESRRRTADAASTESEGGSRPGDAACTNGLQSYSAYASVRDGFRHVFGAYMVCIHADQLDADEVFKRACAVIEAPPVARSREYEILPRGPAVIDADTEVADYTMSRVPNTMARIE